MSYPVLIHKYTDLLTAIEFSSQSAPEHFLVFVGGLGDGFLTVPYVPALAQQVAARLPHCAVVQALISSSYLGFGTGSLARDAAELAQLVRFLRTRRGTSRSRVILMGHSTGCQDTMEYLSKYSQRADFDAVEALDGAILQAPVSDSEAFRHFASDQVDELLALAKSHLENGRPDELLPARALDVVFGAPILAARFVALADRRGADDYFSLYLTAEDHAQTFGRVRVPLLVLEGGADEFVPPHVDRADLVRLWQKATPPEFWSARSKVVPGALHNAGETSAPGAQDDVVRTAVDFVADVLGDESA